MALVNKVEHLASQRSQWRPIFGCLSNFKSNGHWCFSPNLVVQLLKKNFPVNVWLSLPVTSLFKACNIVGLSEFLRCKWQPTVLQKITFFLFLVWLTRTMCWKLQGAAKRDVNSLSGFLQCHVSVYSDVIFSWRRGGVSWGKVSGQSKVNVMRWHFSDFKHDT